MTQQEKTKYVCNMALCKSQNKVNAKANIGCYYINCPFLTVKKFGRKLKVLEPQK